MHDGPPDPPSPARAPRGTQILFYVLCAVLLIIGWGKISVDLGRWFHFMLGGSAAGVFRVLLATYLAVRLLRPSAWTAPRWLNDAMVWFFLVAICSVAWNAHHDTAQITGVLLPGFTAYLAARYLLDGEFERYGLPLLRVLVVAMTLVSPQIVAYAPKVLRDFSQVDSLYEHHTHVAMRMVMAIPLTIGLLAHDRRRVGDGAEGRPRWAYVVLLVFQIVGITIANSRIGWMALGAVGLYGILLGSSRRMRLWYVLALLLMVALPLAFPKARANFETMLHLREESNFQRRVIIYSTDLRLIREHPLLGLGFSSVTFTEAGRQILGNRFMWEHPHDLFLQVPVYLGLPGVASFIWLLVSLGRAMIVLRRHTDPSCGPLLFGLRGALLGLLVMNVAETALSSERVTFMIPVLFAFILSWARSVSKNPAER